jgi:hypothetical protein
MQKVKIDIELTKQLSELTEIVEVLDHGIKFLTTKNGVVMRETFGKWGHVLCKDGDVVWIEDEVATKDDTSTQIIDDANLDGKKKSGKPRVKKV